jgi:hypothetical protein
VHPKQIPCGGRKRSAKRSLLVQFLPILFFELYLNFTVVLFAFGPWPWPVRNPVKLYGFLAASHVALFLGYVSVLLVARLSRLSRYENTTVRSFFSTCPEHRSSRLLIVSIILNLVLLPLTFLSRTGKVLPDLRSALLNPGDAYGSARVARASGFVVFEYVRILLAPWLFPLIPLTAFYWPGMRRKLRLGAVVAVLGLLSVSIATGTNKGIADFVLISPWLVLAAHFSGIGNLKRRQKMSLFLLLILAFAIFVGFFTRGQMTRQGSGALSFYTSTPGLYADTDNFLVGFLPFNVKVGLVALSSYLTQGYYALSLALECPFVPMFGVGNSMFLFLNFSDLFKLHSIRELPYPVRLERFGWDAYGKWSSIYPWIASDVSFVGTLGVVFLIGLLFGLTWLDTLQGTNPLAICMFAQFLIMLFYFPANNQVAQSGEPFVSFYVLLVLWLLTRRGRRLRLRWRW